MKNVAVTGAGGFIGAYLTRRLVQDGHNVVAIDNFARGQESRLAGLAGHVSLMNADVRDTAAMEKAFVGIDAVFHLAAINGTENFYTQPRLVLDVGVRGALAVSEACIASGVSDLVIASSAEVYQTPSIVPTPEDIDMVIPNSLNPRYSYGGSKLISELIAFNYCRDKLEKVQVFRPHNIYGPDMGWKHVVPQLILKCQSSVRENVPHIQLQGDGSETRAFCYVDDAVDGILTMWTNGSSMNVYHIGSMEEVRIKTLAELVVSSVGAELELLTGEPVEGGTPRRCPDISKMKSIGYMPKVSLSDGVSRAVEWYMSNPRSAELNDLL